MKVGLNLLYLVPGATGGTETYARELIPALLAADSSLSLTAFVAGEAAREVEAPWNGLIESISLPIQSRHRSAWVGAEQLLLPGYGARARLAVMHSLGNTAPAGGPFRRVTTIHDLHFRRVPEAHLGVRRLGMEVLVPLAARRSHRLIAPSASTKQDLVAMLRVQGSKVDVIPEGLGRGVGRTSVAAAELRSLLHADGRPIVLSVSAKRPHKNLIRLIEALALIPQERRPLLVVPGYPTAYEATLRRRVDELGITPDVRLLGWIEEAELEGLYEAAACLVCASLHEGFGLPVLEAMVRGVPVACSGGGALSEVAGPAALIFDPTSARQIAGAIERLLGAPEQADRLRRLGLERAAQFSWARTAEQTVLAYERALGSRA